MDEGDRSRIVRELFDQAADLDVAVRTAHLNRHCADPDVRREVEDLLRHHDEARAMRWELPVELVQPRDGEAQTVMTEPRMLGGFRIVRELGRGGMAVVYLARDEQLKREVALKVLPRSSAMSERRIARFRHEGRAIAKLNHGNIVQVYTIGHEGDEHFIAMEYVEGRTLAEQLKWLSKLDMAEQMMQLASRETLRRNVEVIAQVADGLEHAHRHDVIHRDVKPSNILIDGEGCAKLADFGIARILREDGMTKTDETPGTYAYMSPEQAQLKRQKTIDGRADVYSLGVVLYEALTGMPAFTGSSAAEVLAAVLSRDPRPVRAVNRHIPRDLETIAHKAMEKSPDRRYSSAGHMAADLRSWLAGLPILARPAGPVRVAGRWVKRHRRFVVAAAIVMLIALTAMLGMNQRQQWRMNHCAIEVTGDAPGALVYARRFAEASCEPGERALLGAMPVGATWLEGGLYRIEVVRDDGAFEEIDVWLDGFGEVTPVAIAFAHAAAARGDDFESSMALVPEGEYRVGYPGGDGYEAEQALHVDAFWIDLHEVTNAQFSQFVRETNRAMPGPDQWRDLSEDPQWANHPTTGVSWDDALAYAHWAGKRLPTRVEWEAAARFPDGRLYPWGNQPANEALLPSAEEYCRWFRVTWALGYELYHSFARPVDSDVRPSPLGLHYMFGNVEEFTASVAAGQGPIVKGGYWMTPAGCWDLSRTVTMPMEGNRSVGRGFRCARSAAIAHENGAVETGNE